MKEFFGRLWAEFGLQAVRFCAVGGAGLALNSGILYFLTEFLHVYYIYSSWAGAVISQIFAFLGYKYWAFRLDGTRAAYSTGTQFIVHWLVWGAGLGIGTTILYTLTTYVHIWYLYSSWFATAVSATSNFLSHKFFTYKPEKRSDDRIQERDLALLRNLKERT
jgi:putative flippase GtrA